MGSMFQVVVRVEKGKSGWRKVSEVICEKRVAAKVKSKEGSVTGGRAGQVRRCGDRLRWFRHLQRKDSKYICRMMLEMQLQAGDKEDIYGCSERRYANCWRER